MNLTINRHGIPEGFARAGEVILYHAGTQLLILVAAALANYHPGRVTDIRYAYTAATIAIANVVLAGVVKWLTVHTPSEVAPTSPVVAPIVEVPGTPIQGASGVQG